MSVCKDCIHYEICDKYVSPNESFPEVDGCKCFKASADAVKVVRCKDCKWWKRMNGDKRLQCFHGHGLIRTTENDYCSRGERREE